MGGSKSGRRNGGFKISDSKSEEEEKYICMRQAYNLEQVFLYT